LEVGSFFMPRFTWTEILLFMLLLVAGMTGMSHHTQLLVEIEFCYYLPPNPHP
jgi:hypothetical protein